MTVLQKLQEKIEQWKATHEAIKSENAELKSQLENASALQTDQNNQVDTLKNELEEQGNQIAALNRELVEKDVEIEKIITQVETLLA